MLMEDFEQLDYYQLLGVPYDASTEEIKRAYRQQVARYHPDRYAHASPEEQTYAGQRTQRLNEAYRVLSDFRARQLYDRSRSITPSRRAASTTGGPGRSAARSTGETPTTPRDHQADLYDQAQEHLRTGRYLQAIAVLRQLQQLNPFYRDSAALLARAEAASRGESASTTSDTARSTGVLPTEPVRRARNLVFLGGIGLVALIGIFVAVLALRPREDTVAGNTAMPDQPSLTATAATPVAGVAKTGEAEPTTGLATTGAPEPTIAPTAEPAATSAPTSTTLPTPPPEPPITLPAPPLATPSPRATGPQLTQAAERGAPLFAYDFSGQQGWAIAQGNGWSVGPVGGIYRITVEPGIGNIWSYRTVPAITDFTVGVDTQIRGGGAAGLLLRFVDGNNYLAFLIDPLEGSYRLEQRRGGGTTILLQEQTRAIQTGEETFNRLIARLEGNTVELFINDQPVADIIVDVESTQLYGLVATARDIPAEASFDNLEVRAAGEEERVSR